MAPSTVLGRRASGDTDDVAYADLGEDIGPHITELLGFGSYVAVGLFGEPTWFTGGTAWDDAGVSGMTLIRGLHHDGPNFVLYFYAVSTDMTAGKVLQSIQVNASSLVDARSSISQIGGYVENVAGDKYVNATLSNNMRPGSSLTEKFAGLYIDTDDIVSFMRLGYYQGVFQFDMYPVTGQTAPTIIVRDTSSVDMLSIYPGVIEYVETSDPAAPADGRARVYAKSAGGSKTGLYVRFPTGAVQQIAVEP